VDFPQAVKFSEGSARTGGEGLGKLRDQPFDVVIPDPQNIVANADDGLLFDKLPDLSVRAAETALQ
jgi:hypothetical protein